MQARRNRVASVERGPETSTTDRSTLLSAADELLHVWGVKPPTKRSDFVEHVAVRLIRKLWAADRGKAPNPRTVLDSGDQAILSGLVTGTFESDVRRGAEACEAVLQTVADFADAEGVRLPSQKVSERACTRVGRALVEATDLDLAFVESTAAELVAVLSGPTAMPKNEFIAAWSDAYDAAWTADGCTSTQSWPPTAIGLGLDRRPALVPVSRSGTGHHNWSAGTNRTVYERYSLHFKATARGEPTTCANPSCANPRPAERVDPAPVEVHRACQVYGLSLLEHQTLLRSVAEGLEAEPTRARGWMRWEEWATPCRPVDVSQPTDGAISDAMASALAAWPGTDVGHLMVGQHGMSAILPPLRRITIRKFWMDAHRYERTWAEPMRRCAIARTARSCLYKLIVKAYRDWVDGRLGDPDPSTMAPACPEGQPSPENDPDPTGVAPKTGHAPTASELSDVERQNRTLDLLAQHPRVFRRFASHDPEWTDSYEDLTAHETGQHLSVEELAALLTALMKEMGDD